MKRFSLCGSILAILLVASFSCGNRSSYLPPPAGSYSDVVLVTETGKVEGPAEVMVRELRHELDFYTRNEYQFNVKIVPAARLEDEIPVKNMVLFGIVGEGRLGRYIEKFVGSSGVADVYAGRVGVFKKMNYPVEGQLTLIVTAASQEALERIAKAEAALIRDIIEVENRERLRNSLLKSENADLETILRSRYGFNLRVPSLYELGHEDPSIPAVEIWHTKPHRGLAFTCRAFDRSEVALTDSSELYRMREDFAYRMYDKEVMRRELVKFYSTKLGPYPAVRMDGYWESSVDAYGGAFVSFFLVDRVKARLWLIDCVVFAPGTDKNELFRELISIAETFRL